VLLRYVGLKVTPGFWADVKKEISSTPESVSKILFIEAVLKEGE